MSGQGDDSEEKNLPATDHSLRKAREKGQVATSKDLTTTMITLAGLLFVATSWQKAVAIFAQGIDYAVDPQTKNFDDTYRISLALSIINSVYFLVPLVPLIVITAIVSNILDKKGIPFSVHPITPDFKKLNPASGFKKLFSVRSISEFFVSLIKISLWLAISALLVWYALPSALIAPTCDIACVANVAADLMLKIVIAAIILLIVGAILDLPMQHTLFLRENRMSKTQLKREIKETQGTPEYKSLRREAQRSMNQTTPAAAGSPFATLLIQGIDMVVALRFDLQQTPVPIVVARGRGAQADEILLSAAKLKVPVETDTQLAEALYRGGLPGQQIPERLFQRVATLIVKHVQL